MNNFGWKANIASTDRLMRWQNVYFYQERPKEQSIKMITGWDEYGELTYEEVPDGSEPESPGLVLPYGCLDALAPLLRPGPSEEVLDELRLQLATELSRVDKFLQATVGQLEYSRPDQVDE